MAEQGSDRKTAVSRASKNGRGAHRTARAVVADTAAKKAKKSSDEPQPTPQLTRYVASQWRDHQLPAEFGVAVRSLEEALGLPVWMLVQGGNEPPIGLYQPLLQIFLNAREELAASGHVALLVDSPGGLAEVAYRMARILQRDGGFTVVIPRYAKSAATLLALGAVRAIMGEDAEIGPLDAQLWDHEREEPGSALNEVQALDQLHSVAPEHLDRTMLTVVGGTKKKTDVLLPIAAKFVSDMMCPMLEKIDAVHYAKQARILAVAEHYAVRLLATAGIPSDQAQKIADALVNGYPEHGFVIDKQEVAACRYLPLVDPGDAVDKAVHTVERVLSTTPVTAFGLLKEQK